MTAAGVILYGPPASGKGTVTVALLKLRSEYTQFRRLKAGPGRTEGYRSVSSDRLAELVEAGDIVYQNERYGAEYAVDRTELEALRADGRIPVVHLGQVAGVLALQELPGPWVTVLMWCGLETTTERSRGRGDRDVAARSAAWIETRQDLVNHADTPWSVVIETDHLTATEAADLIDAAVAKSAGAEIRSIKGLVS